MRTLIVAKTVMGRAYCVGGWTQDNQSVRLLLPGANCHPLDTRFNVGDIWDLEFHPRKDVEPPHVEDVIVTGSAFERRIQNLREILVEHARPWRGNASALYNGRLGWTSNGSGFVSEERGLPDVSTGFWIPDQDLTISRSADKVYYHYPARFAERRLSYVGTQDAIERIPAGTLVRVSLARWWAPEESDMEPRCYLQLSGWYT